MPAAAHEAQSLELLDFVRETGARRDRSITNLTNTLATVTVQLSQALRRVKELERRVSELESKR